MNSALARVSRRILPVVLGIAVVAGCSGSGGTRPAAGTGSSPAVTAAPPTSAAPSPSLRPGGEADPALKSFYGQQIGWAPCAADPALKNVDMSTFQCGTAHVPLDYAHPTVDTVDLALIRKPAAKADQRLGSLFLNPGGPGGSGIEEVAGGANGRFQSLNQRYDLVGFDPRGVGRSTAVHCLDDAARDKLNAQDHADAGSDQGFADACRAKSGKLLPFVGTVDAARDLDVLRGAVGDQKLDYLGFSYGTYLGAEYAEQFPDRTGRLVLDGAMDPSNDPLDADVAQLVGFEGVFERWAADCPSHSGCPLGKDPAAAAQRAAAFLDGLEQHPMTTSDGRTLTAAEGWTGALEMLYGDAKSWEYLRNGMEWAMQAHKADYLMAFADDYNGRDKQGHYTNMADANVAINCADYGAPVPSDDRINQALAQLHSQAKYLTARMTAEDLNAQDCRDWPYHPSTAPHVIKAAGAAPILVVGSTGDDATPYAWAQHLAAGLADATLLTRDGDGHTGYGKSSCIKKAVDSFLVDGTMPAAGTHCPTDS
ncbi:alpha/beta hydrolase [Streptomyces tateyamensis]|uniref:Alpha/beta hydrolase n=1 Tax=Streptomyces tateyamensis TaxID=565073 RepID=A0A2V4MZI6_9ACTN|nr:alpha/beta hydrolase [Streptomyces tateyamensis]PYC71467.1 alpha/beta hydrolase [Streptomyces tateyamensis]